MPASVPVSAPASASAPEIFGPTSRDGAEAPCARSVGAGGRGREAHRRPPTFRTVPERRPTVFDRPVVRPSAASVPPPLPSGGEAGGEAGACVDGPWILGAAASTLHLGSGLGDRWAFTSHWSASPEVAARASAVTSWRSGSPGGPSSSTRWQRCGAPTRPRRWWPSCRRHRIESWRELLAARFPDAELVAGGDRRQDSVRAGVARAVAGGADVVAVHDAARPAVDPEDVKWVVKALGSAGGAVLCGVVEDAVKRVDGSGLVLETMDRAELRLAQTPQVLSSCGARPRLGGGGLLPGLDRRGGNAGVARRTGAQRRRAATQSQAHHGRRPAIDPDDAGGTVLRGLGPLPRPLPLRRPAVRRRFRGRPAGIGPAPTSTSRRLTVAGGSSGPCRMTVAGDPACRHRPPRPTDQKWGTSVSSRGVWPDISAAEAAAEAGAEADAEGDEGRLAPGLFPRYTPRR